MSICRIMSVVEGGSVVSLFLLGGYVGWEMEDQVLRSTEENGQ